MTPGESENAQAELVSASRALRSGRILLGDDAVEDATSRIYYAVFHAARAALTVTGRYSRTHAGLIDLFRQAYGDAELLDKLLAKRGLADYSIGEFNSTRADVEAWAAEAEQFVERCRAIVRDAVGEGPDESDPPADL